MQAGPSPIEARCARHLRDSSQGVKKCRANSGRSQELQTARPRPVRRLGRRLASSRSTRASPMSARSAARATTGRRASPSTTCAIRASRSKVAEVKSPPGVHSHKLRVVDGDILYVNSERLGGDAGRNARTGLFIFDISKGGEPKQIGFYDTPGTGPHRFGVDNKRKLAFLPNNAPGWNKRVIWTLDITRSAQARNPQPVGPAVDEGRRRRRNRRCRRRTRRRSRCTARRRSAATACIARGGAAASR